MGRQHHRGGRGRGKGKRGAPAERAVDIADDVPEGDGLHAVKLALWDFGQCDRKRW